MPLFPDIIQDAEGRPRHLYNVGAWWRSPSVRADIPRATYEAICDTVESVPPPSLLTAEKPTSRGPATTVLVASLILVHAIRSSGAPFTWFDCLVWATFLACLVVAAFCSTAWQRFGRRIGLRPLLGTHEAVARAMLAHGHCPSCAHQLDLTAATASAEAIIRCPECGAAWHAPPADELKTPPPVPTL